MFNTLIRYISSGLVKFTLSVYITYTIISKLSISDFANFGIASSLIMLFGLLLTLNTETAFQKMYSNKKIWGAVNGAFLVVYICSVLIWALTLYMLLGFLSKQSTNVGILYVVTLDGFIYYGVALTLYNLVHALINALKRTSLYVVLNFLPNLIIALKLSITESLDLQNLFFIYVLSYLTVLSLLLIFTFHEVIKTPLNFKRLNFFIKYIIVYSIHSIHTIGTKYILDLVLKSLILDRFGVNTLAAYNIANSVLGIFRSIEQNITKAITPIFLSLKNQRSYILSKAKYVILFQSVVTVFIFLLSFMWYPFLKYIFPDKPAILFYPNILVGLATMMVIGYWKNYFIIIIKQRQHTMKLLYLQTSTFNVLSIILVYFVGYNIFSMLSILIIMQAGNLLLIKWIRRAHYG